jgi:hypothetical protein
VKQAIVAVIASVAACSRAGGGAPVDGGSSPASSGIEAPVTRTTEAPPAAAPEAAAPAPSPRPSAATPPPALAEASRSALPALERDPLLRSQLATLHEHFGAGAHGPFAAQRVDLVGGRTATLVSRADESDAIVLVLDREQLVWSKRRPTAGIVPPVLHAAIAPRPDGGLALFAYVSAMHLLAARMWADDGNAYAEIELGAFDTCEALSAAYAPSRGWVVACASSTGTRAQRLREDGTTAWGRDGAWLGVESTVGRAAIAFDTPSTFVVVQRARAIGGDRLLAARFDDDARPLWPAAVHVAALAGSTAADGLRASLAGDGLVRIEAAGRSFEVRSDGQTRSVPR